KERRMRLCLVEDNAVAGLEPLTLTRPVFELLLGGGTLGGKIAKALGVGAGPARRGAVIRPFLAALQRERDPHTVVNDRAWVARNADHLERDFAAEGKLGVSNRHLTTLALVGPADRLFIHETARIDPYTVFDTTNGPISVAAGVVVQPFTRVEGPSFIGRDTQ